MDDDLRLRLAVLAWGIVLSLFAATADAKSSHGDLNSAWRQYASSGGQQPALRFPHAACFKSAALAHGLPESLLLAVARGESDFEATARSKANAHGVMQIQWPGTAKHLGIYRLSQLYDPCTNIDAGTRYLKELLGNYNGNLHLALAAYNYGPGRIPKNGEHLPGGAIWYSGYIYRHLEYVLGDGRPAGRKGTTLYSELGQSTLVTFSEPYRAAAFIERLEASIADLRLDWFRRGTGEFEVVLSYADKEEFQAAAQRISRAGFPIE